MTDVIGGYRESFRVHWHLDSLNYVVCAFYRSGEDTFKGWIEEHSSTFVVCCESSSALGSKRLFVPTMG